MNEAPPELDITAETCPITFVRAKLVLEKIPVGARLSIRLRNGEPLDNVPRSLVDHGHRVISLEPIDRDVYRLVVERGSR